MEKLYGTGVALVTPFDQDKNIDFDGLKALLDYTATQGIDYYVVQGTTGESATTSAREKADILQFIKHNNKYQLPIVFGIGGNNTQGALAHIKATDFEGVDAILSVSPYYNKPSQEGIYQHYQHIADACPVPVIIYNVPGRTMSNIAANTSLRLAEHENIIGVKEASGNVEQAMQIVKSKPDNFMLISGDDLLTGSLYAIGADGVISVLANAFARQFKVMKEGVQTGDYEKVRKALFSLLDINPMMYEESNPVGIKHALKVLGVCENYVRMPLLEASIGLQERIAQETRKLQSV